MRETAIKNGMPLVLLNESSGARIPDTMGAVGTGALGQDPEQFIRRRECPTPPPCWVPPTEPPAGSRNCPTSSPCARAACWPCQPQGHGDRDQGKGGPGRARRLADAVRDHRQGRLRHRHGRRGPRSHQEVPVVSAESPQRTPPEAAAPAGSDDAGRKDPPISSPPSARRSTTCARWSRRSPTRDSVFEMKPRFARAATTALARNRRPDRGVRLLEPPVQGRGPRPRRL